MCSLFSGFDCKVHLTAAISLLIHILLRGTTHLIAEWMQTVWSEVSCQGHKTHTSHYHI